MATDIYREIRAGFSTASPARLGFTRKAFEMLPELDHPRILDIGCGQGGPTLELARLSNGEVIGLDIDQECLDELWMRIGEAGLSDRVHVVNGSMREMDFQDESFDVIWSEGSIHVVGFEEGLEEWGTFIRPNGFLVAHDMVWLQPYPPQEIVAHWQSVYPGITTVSERLEQIPLCGYEVIGHFPVPEHLWWLDYYGPLEERIPTLRQKHAEDESALEVLVQAQAEVDLFKKYSRWYGSAFFVMQRRKHVRSL
jgi:SAM-dependent methyltransferase